MIEAVNLRKYFWLRLKAALCLCGGSKIIHHGDTEFTEVLPKDDDKREQWLTLSKSRFADASVNGEDDYPLELIKDTNSEYEAR
jgi:hypothetical protein